MKSDNIWHSQILSEETLTVRVKSMVKWRPKDISNNLVCRISAKGNFRHEMELT